jgi:hypothetical protein
MCANTILVSLISLFSGCSQPQGVVAFIASLFSPTKPFGSLLSPAVILKIHKYVMSAARAHVLRSPGRGCVPECGQQPDFERLCRDLFTSAYFGGASNVVPVVAEHVSLPSRSMGVSVEKLLPEQWAQFYRNPDNVLIPDRDRQPLGPLAPSMASPLELGKLYARMQGLGLIRLVRNGEAKATSPIFALQKEAGADDQRVIVNMVGVNKWFTMPPKLDLPSPDDLAKLQMEPNITYELQTHDLSSYYNQLLLDGGLEYLQDYLGLPPVPAALVGPEAVAMFGADALVQALLIVVPMGWNHACYIAQQCHENALQASPEFAALGPIKHELPANVSHGRGDLYIDDAFVIRPVQLSRGVDQLTVSIRQAYSVSGLTESVKKHQPPAVVGNKALGLIFDGARGIWYPPPTKLSALIWATRLLVHRGYVSSKGLQRIVGLWQWYGLLQRPVLSVFRAVYAFIEKYRLSRQRRKLWPNVASELTIMAGLAPLLVGHCKRSTFSKVLATDASPLGGGVCAAPLSVDLTAKLLDWAPRRKPWALFDEMAAMFTSLVPASDWKVKFAHVWRSQAHINVLELTTFYLALRWVVSHPVLSCRLLTFLDSQVCLSVLAKGRTSSPRLIVTMRRIACICLATNISITGAYVRSEHNPADFPSRSPELFSGSK